MAQDIRKLFENENKLSNLKMPEGHEKRFLKKLNEAMPEESEKKFPSFFGLMIFGLKL